MEPFDLQRQAREVEAALASTGTSDQSEGAVRGDKRAGRVAGAASRGLRACQMLRMRRAWRARGELTA